MQGSHNNLSTIDMVRGNSDDRKCFWGVHLSSPGGNNTVERLTCSGYLKANKDWGIYFFPITIPLLEIPNVDLFGLVRMRKI